MQDKKRSLWNLGISAGLLVVVAGSALIYQYIHTPEVIPGLPKEIVAKASFTVYEFKNQPPLSYRIDPATINFDKELLVFQLVKPGSPSITVTQQAMGGYSNLSRTHNEVFTTDYGQANIQENMSRTTGEIFTSDNTWIIANASQPIGKSSMQQILLALHPAP